MISSRLDSRESPPPTPVPHVAENRNAIRQQQDAAGNDGNTAGRTNTLATTQVSLFTHDWDLIGVDVDCVHLLADAAERGLHAQLGKVGPHKPVRVLGDLHDHRLKHLILKNNSS